MDLRNTHHDRVSCTLQKISKDHDILVRRLQQSFGICGTALEWLQSFLHGRSQQVSGSCRQSSSCSSAIHRALSSACCCFCWTLPSCSTSSRVPDSSDTRTPTTHRCTSVLQPHPRRFQRNVSSPALNASMSGCVATGWGWTPTWHSSYGLEHASSLLSWPLPSYHYVPLRQSALVKPSSAVLDLGVNIDGQLTMAVHVAVLRRSFLFQLRQLRMVRSSLTLEAAKTLVHAFFSSRLDYCNSLLYGIGSACWRNCRLSRMQQRVSWPELGSSTTSLHCVNFTGFRSASESPSS